MLVSNAQDWKEVAEALDGLALKLKMHAEEFASSTGSAVHEAVDGVGSSVDAAFTALHDAVTDDALKQDVTTVATLVRDALANSFSVFKAVGESKAGGESKAAPAHEG